jgi:hypothetical protein
MYYYLYFRNIMTNNEIDMKKFQEKLDEQRVFY